MRPCFPASALLTTITALFLFAAPSAQPQQTDTDRFELRGTVINSATREPISGALVQMNGNEVRFTDSDGAFEFSEVARGQCSVMARKPGFFNEQELGSPGANPTAIVPSDKPLVLKLTPEAIIYGQAKNESGEPIEGITVRAQAWHVDNGRRQLEPAGDSITNDLGNFRLPELRPGNYYLSFERVNQGRTSFDGVGSKKTKQQDQGFGLQFYPGVADTASATAIPIRPGAQLHIIQTLSPLRLFEIRGTVRAPSLDGGLSIRVMNASGDNVQTGMRVDRTTGQFQIQGVPAGNYLLWATVWRPRRDETEPNLKPLVASLPISVSANISGLVLAVGDGISIPVRVRDETSDGGTSIHQVWVQMLAKEFLRATQGTQAPGVENGQIAKAEVDYLAPGTYAVEATPQFRGYVADLRCGSVDLLRDDLVIAPDATPAPIDVVVRDDAAELAGTVVQNGQPAGSGVVIYSLDYPKQSILIRPDTGSFSADVPPGRYEVFALENGRELEFKNPAAVEKYLGHAKALALAPREKAVVRLDLEPLEAEQ